MQRWRPLHLRIDVISCQININVQNVYLCLD
jgi:hypothetical protein